MAFVALALAGVALVVLSIASLRSYRSSANETLQAAQVTVQVEALLIDLRTAEGWQLRYLLTNDPAFVESFEEEVAKTQSRLDRIAEQTAGHEGQQQLIAELRPMIEERVALLSNSIELATAGQVEEAIAVVESREGLAMMDNILAALTNLVRVEAEQHNQARSTADTRATQSLIAVCALAVVTAALLGWVFWALRRQHVEESLRQANRDKDEFLGMVSHELRTPITVVLGNARLLRRAGERLAQEEQARSVIDIESHGERMQRIVENMLTLSRDRVFDQSTEPVMMSRLIAEAVERHRSQLPNSEVAVSIEPDLPMATANSAYVDQVLQNLLSNAAKYGSPEHPIEVVAEHRHGRVQVSVMDRGPGIEPGTRARIFEPFVRLANTEGSAEGLGLGLPVCKRLMEAQGGDIAVSAREGGGSVFTFSLAAVEELEEQEHSEPEALAAS